MAVLIPEPGHPDDHNAIAVHVNGFPAGYLSRQIAGIVQPALIAFTAANSGRHVACPARILWREIHNQPIPQVILNLDPAPLGLPPEAFDHVPELDRLIQQHLRRLDVAAPAMTGCDPDARSRQPSPTLLAEVGVPPQLLRRMVVAFRACPIHVGGPSGPMGREITWESVAQRSGLPAKLLKDASSRYCTPTNCPARRDPSARATPSGRR